MVWCVHHVKRTVLSSVMYIWKTQATTGREKKKFVSKKKMLECAGAQGNEGEVRKKINFGRKTQFPLGVAPLCATKDLIIQQSLPLYHAVIINESKENDHQLSTSLLFERLFLAQSPVIILSEGVDDGEEKVHDHDDYELFKHKLQPRRILKYKKTKNDPRLNENYWKAKVD